MYELNYKKQNKTFDLISLDQIKLDHKIPRVMPLHLLLQASTMEQP